MVLKFIRHLFTFIYIYRSTVPGGPEPPQCWDFTITHRHATLGRSRLYKRSARRRDLYLTTLNNHKRNTSVPRRHSNPQSQQARDPAATGIGELSSIHLKKEEVTKCGNRWCQVTFQSRDFSCSAVSEWIHAYKFLYEWLKPVVSSSITVQFKTENNQGKYLLRTAVLEQGNQRRNPLPLPHTHTHTHTHK